MEPIKINKEALNIGDNNITVVYVVISNRTVYNVKTKEKDEYTNIIRVFQTEKCAQDYIVKAKGKLSKGTKIDFFSIPTPFGDIDTNGGAAE